VLEQERAKFEVGPEVGECGGGGDELEVAGRDQGDVGIVAEDNLGGVDGGTEMEDLDADLGLFGRAVLKDGADVLLEVGAGDAREEASQGDYKRGGGDKSGALHP
jgi:hypothetical protein